MGCKGQSHRQLYSVDHFMSYSRLHGHSCLGTDFLHLLMVVNSTISIIFGLTWEISNGSLYCITRLIMHQSNTIRLTYFPFLNLTARTKFKRCMRSWTYILIVLDTGVMHIDSSGAWVRMTSRRHRSAQTAWRAAQPSPSLMLAAAIAAATVDIYQSAALPHHTLPLTRPRKSHYRPT
jgi:hypothetical protein